MKKLIFLTLALALFVFAFLPIAKATYTISEYRDEVGYRGSLDPQLDPIYQIIKSLNAGSAIGTGKIWYVDSGATGGATGFDLENACLTIEAAINIADTDGAANRGDRIYVAQGHAYTKSATGALFTADVAGMSIICLGKGDNRAKLTLKHTGATIDITADNVRFSGFYLDATGVDSVNAPLNVSGEGCILDNFFIRLGDTNGQADKGITIGLADGDANDLIIANGVIVSPDTGPVSAITFAFDMENVILANLYIYGDFSAAAIEVQSGGDAQVNLIIDNCTIISKNAGEPAFEASGTGNTGVIRNSVLISDAEVNIVDAGGLQIANSTSLLLIGDSEGAALPANMTLIDLIGDYTGPDSGSAADDNIKAHLDLVLADTGAMDTSAELVALVDPNYISYDAPRLVATTTSAMGGGAYEAVDDPVIFTVTGDILCRACATISTPLTSTSADTIELGISGRTAILLVQDVVDSPAFDTGDVWTLTIPAENNGVVWLVDDWIVIANGADIVLTINDNNITAGVMTFYLQWIPMSADAAVAGAAP